MSASVRNKEGKLPPKTITDNFYQLIRGGQAKHIKKLVKRNPTLMITTSGSGDWIYGPLEQSVHLLQDGVSDVLIAGGADYMDMRWPCHRSKTSSLLHFICRVTNASPNDFDWALSKPGVPLTINTIGER